MAIDAGTAGQRVRAALSDAGLEAGRIGHVILTHSHFDHAGGIGALLQPGVRVIAQAAFPAELQRQHANTLPFRYFIRHGAGFGGGERAEPAVIAVNQLVSEPASVSIGGTELVRSRPPAARRPTR